MFFTLNDDFDKIIKLTLKDNTAKVEKILTGWTNFVFKATNKDNEMFIFRFPRNYFFAKTLIKEEIFNKFIADKISFKVPEIQLFYNNNIPYTMHKFIQGRTLTQCYKNLTTDEIINLSKDIATFIFQLQQISLPTNKIIIDSSTLKLDTLSNFLKELSKVGNENYDLKQHKILNKLEKKNLILGHSDFNPGNILLDNNNKMVAVLDFAFVGKTNNLVDISRVVGRLPKEFEAPLLFEFENKFKQKINKKHINKLIEMWNYVEKMYTVYIRKNHPDIILPDSLE